MKRASNATVAAAVVILTFAASQSAAAFQCEQPPADPDGDLGPAQGTNYTYRIMSGFTGDEEAGIDEAFAAWQARDVATGLDVTFTKVSGAADFLVFSECSGCSGFNEPGGNAVGRDGNGRPTGGTIQVNKGALVNGKIPVKKVVGHEVGHIHGLGDHNGDDGSSIMNQFDTFNDGTGNLPEEVTTCDADKAWDVWVESQEPEEEGPCPECPISPLVLDVDGGGIPTTNVAAEPAVFFDLDADGELERVAWLAYPAGDAFLFLDRNGNQAVDGGGELFGSATTMPDGSTAGNGWEALSIHDSSDFGGNGDRLISARDHIWNSLMLWFDTNYNGVSEPGELSSVADQGIQAISLRTRKRSWEDPQGNLHSHQSIFFYREPAGGGRGIGSRVRIGLVEDIWFLVRER